MANEERLVVFLLDGRRYAVALERVERVVARPEIAAFPQAPDVVSGVFMLHGDLVPVMNVRMRFRLPDAPARLSEQLVVVRTRRRRVALVVDQVDGVVAVAPTDWVDAGAIVPGLEHVRGVARLADDMVFVHDIDAFLSLDEEDRLAAALHEEGWS